MAKVDEFKNLAAEYAKLGNQFEEQIKQYNVKQLVAVHEQKIKDSAATKTSSSKQRSSELAELLKEVKKLVKKHEENIKKGQVTDQIIAEMKAHYAKLREHSDKLSRELGSVAGGTAATATVVAGATPNEATSAAAENTNSAGKAPPPLPPKNPKKGTEGTADSSSAGSGGGGGVLKIVLAIIGLAVIGAGVAVTVKPELVDLIIPPPPKPTSTIGNLFSQPEPKAESMMDKIRAAASAKADEERRKKEEEDAAQSMMMMGVGVAVVVGLVVIVLVMMNKSSAPADVTPDSGDRYGRYVKEKSDGDEVYSSHRLDGKKSP